MKKKTQSNLSPSDFSIVPFQNERRTINSANCIFSNFLRSWKYSLTSIKCRHFLISSCLLNIFKMADYFIRIIFDSSKAITVSLRPSRPNRISVCPKMRRMPNCLVILYSDEHEKLPSRTKYMYLSRPSQASLAYMDAPCQTMTASCAMQRLMKFSELVSKNLLKKGRRDSDLAISMPQKGILSCYYLERTLNICCNYPFTYRLNSSMVFYNTTKLRQHQSNNFFSSQTNHGYKYDQICVYSSFVRQQLSLQIVRHASQDVFSFSPFGDNRCLSSFILGLGKSDEKYMENDILQNHLDILYPETGRYSKTAATYNVDQQYEEVLVFTSKKIQAETKEQTIVTK